MKHLLTVSAAVMASLCTALASSAQDTPSRVRLETLCSPAGYIAEAASEYSKLKDTRRDTVRMIATARFITTEPFTHLPDRTFQRVAGAETDFEVEPSGRIADFDRLADAPDGVEFCTTDVRRAGLPVANDGLSIAIYTDVGFIDRSGRHGADTLRDGLRDGRAHLRKDMGALSFAVPKLSHLLVRADMPDTALDIAGERQGEVVELPVDEYCGMPLIAMSGVEDAGVDTLTIEGGGYLLMPVPGPKLLQRFWRCDNG